MKIAPALWRSKFTKRAHQIKAHLSTSLLKHGVSYSSLQIIKNANKCDISTALPRRATLDSIGLLITGRGTIAAMPANVVHKSLIRMRASCSSHGSVRDETLPLLGSFTVEIEVTCSKRNTYSRHGCFNLLIIIRVTNVL